MFHTLSSSQLGDLWAELWTLEKVTHEFWDTLYVVPVQVT
jgi:hypothetical protein